RPIGCIPKQAGGCPPPSGPGGSLLLLRDDVVLDLVVGGLRDDLLLDQVVLPPVRTVVDDLLGIGLADPGEALQLVRGGAVDVERRLLLLGRRLGGLARGRRGGLRRLRLHGRQPHDAGGEQEGDGQRDQSCHVGSSSGFGPARWRSVTPTRDYTTAMRWAPTVQSGR